MPTDYRLTFRQVKFFAIQTGLDSHTASPLIGAAMKGDFGPMSAAGLQPTEQAKSYWVKRSALEQTMKAAVSEAKINAQIARLVEKRDALKVFGQS